VTTLLENAQAANRLFSYEVVSPFSRPDDVVKLQKQYQVPKDPFGLLVLYGEEPGADSTFVKQEDLTTSARLDQEGKFNFKGESALMNAISFLEEGKSKAAIYFTQGSGELSFREAGFDDRTQRSMAALVRRLGESNYEVHEISLGLKADRIPSDAGVVVIARPTRPMSETAIGALRDYLKGSEGKKGKLVVLLDAASAEGKPVHTGLEALLAEYNVRVGDERIMSLSGRPNSVQVMPNPEGRNPIAQAFLSRGGARIFVFDEARTVEPDPARARPEYTAETILDTYPDRPMWKQVDLSADPQALLRDYARLFQERKFDRFSQEAISVGAAVTDGGAPPFPGHPSLASTSQPRLVVFGAANWISDEGLQSDRNYDLFTSSLSWLREKPTLGEGTKGAERETYSLKISDAATLRLYWLPLGLMLTTIVAAGLGVWVVRRR
jgi:hypothetical protein